MPFFSPKSRKNVKRICHFPPSRYFSLTSPSLDVFPLPTHFKNKVEKSPGKGSVVVRVKIGARGSRFENSNKMQSRKFEQTAESKIEQNQKK
jgi:hypothetical protein